MQSHLTTHIYTAAATTVRTLDTLLQKLTNGNTAGTVTFQAQGNFLRLSHFLLHSISTELSIIHFQLKHPSSFFGST